MKVLYKIGLFFTVICISFAGGFWANHYLDKQKALSSQETEQTKEYEFYRKEVASEAETKEEGSNEVKEVASQGELIDCDTKYQVEALQSDTNEVEIIDEELPAKYIGMNREQLEAAIQEYNIAPTLRDQEKGFVTASLQRFSPEKIVVQKKYAMPIPEGFYLAVKDNYIIVYEADLTTVFMTTEIHLEDLPQTVRDEIMNMKFLNSEKEVYDFLESYSS